MGSKVKKLEELRDEIDVIDSEIVKLLVERMSVVLQIKEEKKNQKFPIEDLNREEKVLRNFQSINLNKNFIKDLYDVIFFYSKQEQSTD